MADDGMLLNFSVQDALLGVKPVFKGGRWRDRLQAKRSHQQRKERNAGNRTLTGSNAVPTKPKETSNEEISRPAKRQRITGANPRSTNTSTKPKEIISSLFTYNPNAKSSKSLQTQAEDAPTPEPSNAPLPATASPFTSLGLSPYLSTYLTQNLSLTAPTAIQRAAITQLLREDSDAFIQAETGSGKTLAYLLPILQRILSLSKIRSETSTRAEEVRKLDRSSGLFALILAPTRELTHQILSVFDRLLRPLPWLVAGTVTGGSTKNHEKSRIRKGINILIATPGRLADHLEHTEALDMSSVRWLVLDEGDRLMELGFEEEIRGIVKKLEEVQARKRPEKIKVRGLPERRTTVLCSATMKMGVQKLGEISLKDAVHIKAEVETSATVASSPGASDKRHKGEEKVFLAPAQLQQSYVVVPPKQRLVTLAALLKWTFARKGSVMKAIVFLSCADSVDFHFEVFARKGSQLSKETSFASQNSRNNGIVYNAQPREASPPNDGVIEAKSTKERLDLATVAPTTTLASTSNPNLKLYKLHGSLEQKIRTATLQSFTQSSDPSILLCTDVASRGLDLPNIDVVIEYDPPFSSDDHLHRVGRTARAGKEGRACCFLMPGPEEGYRDVLGKCAGEGFVRGESAEDVLRKGFTSTGTGKYKTDAVSTGTSGKWDDRATDWQLDVERWVIDSKRAGEMAKKAFISHVRAYATHVVKERAMFDVKALHLGHLAKAFALRERPGNMGRAGGTSTGVGGKREKRRGDEGHSYGEGDGHGQGGANQPDLAASTTDGQHAARKMRVKINEQAKAGASEFNIG